MSRLLSMPVTYVVLVIALVALALFAYSMLELRRARTGLYWRIRKEAGQRGGQLFLISVTLFGIALVVAFFTGFAAIAIDEFNDLIYGTPNPFPGIALPTATFTPNFPTPDVEGTVNVILTTTALAIPTQIPSDTPTPTEAATSTTSPTPTGLPSAIPTETTIPTETEIPTTTPSPSPTFEAALSLTPPASTLQPRPDASVSILAVAPEITTDQQPANASNTLPAGVARLYFFMTYQNMDNGITWSRILYREGVPVQGGTYAWMLGEEGEIFFFFGREGGYPAGDYEMRLFLGEKEASRFKFTITS